MAAAEGPRPLATAAEGHRPLATAAEGHRPLAMAAEGPHRCLPLMAPLIPRQGLEKPIEPEKICMNIKNPEKVVLMKKLLTHC